MTPTLCPGCRQKKKEMRNCPDCSFQLKLKINDDLESTDPKTQKRGLRNVPPNLEEFLI